LAGSLRPVALVVLSTSVAVAQAPSSATSPADATPNATADATADAATVVPTATPAATPTFPPPPATAPTSSLAPFGPGTAIHVTASGDPVTVYVARPWPDGSRPYDTDFAKVGKTPITFALPPGTYFVEVEGFNVSRGELLLTVRDEPKRLLVRTGSESLSSTGTLLVAVGVAAALGATAVLVGGSTQSEGLETGKIAIPLYIAGGALIGIGIGLFVASNTNVEEQRSGAPSAENRGAAHRELVLGAGFSF
jgi:hypothetical protein